ncbi:MAG: hypothetical protein GKR86_16040, partial [Ilumatobacter sp.]|nr:hypothetical protein [Ilumatobacter sp.]
MDGSTSILAGVTGPASTTGILTISTLCTMPENGFCAPLATHVVTYPPIAVTIVIASPSTNPNGIAGRKSGIASANASRSTCRPQPFADNVPTIERRVAMTPGGYAPVVDLNGVWRVTPADDDRRRDGIGLDTDDSAWSEIDIPGHWRNHPDFVDSDGPLLHRRRFEMDQLADDHRRWLTLAGIFYQADVWFDGAYLGDAEGYFMPHTFDVTALSRLGDEHVVAVETVCSPQTSHRGKRNITGIFQHWDGIDRDWNPGGIWRPVLIYDTGPARIERLRVLCRDADEERAHLTVRAAIDCDESRLVTIRTYVDGEAVTQTQHRLAGGSNEVHWGIDIGNPQLWWPRSLG